MPKVLSSGYLTLDGTVQSLATLADSPMKDLGFNTLRFIAPAANGNDVYIGTGDAGSSGLDATTGVDLVFVIPKGTYDGWSVHQGNPFHLNEFWVKGTAGQKVLVVGLRF